VAREKGQAFIDAYVTEIHTPGRVDKNTDLKKLVLEQEYGDFLKETSLDRLYPGEDFRFTLPGQYDKVLQHISVHRWFMGEKLNRPISDEEAIKGWYKEVYHPLVRIIQKHDMLRNFRNRTPMDLYLWILEHRWYLADEQKRRVSLESAALDFSKHFSKRPFRHVTQIWNWLVRKIKKKEKKNRH